MTFSLIFICISCGLAAEKPQASFVDEVRSIRKLSGVTFYITETIPLRRQLFIDEDRTPSIRSAMFPIHTGGQNASVEDQERAMQVLREMIGRLRAASSRGEIVQAPLFQFLTWHPGHGQDLLLWDSKHVEAAEQAYNKNPSTVLAVAYLELALIQRARHLESQYKASLSEAIEVLELSKVDYASDRDFRKSLPQPVNFARPESCILFLAAECARQNGGYSDATDYYSHLINIDPSGPCSWEALVRLRLVPNMDKQLLRNGQSAVMEGFPSVWGCLSLHQRLRPISKDESASRLPLIFQKLALEIQEAERK
jgi:hypothetical protein